MTSMQEAWPFNSRSSTARRTPQSSSSSVPAETVETAGIELKQANAGSDCMEGCCQDIETEERQQITPGPPTGAVIGGILGALAFIGIIIGIIFFIRKRQEDGEGPPKHKPPPPVKAGSSTEMLNKPSEPPTATETAPLSPGEVYYEPTGREPVTNLDDETTGALNGGAQPVLDDSAKYGNINELKEPATDGHHGNDMESSSHEPPAANISRGESFVSPAMYV